MSTLMESTEEPDDGSQVIGTCTWGPKRRKGDSHRVILKKYLHARFDTIDYDKLDIVTNRELHSLL